MKRWIGSGQMNLMKIGILGYGNLGKGVEIAVQEADDMELVGVYTRRNPMDIQPIFLDTKVYSSLELEKHQDIDVLILCGGSANDLPWQTPKYAEMYHVVDSFDHHEMIPAHFNSVDQAARNGEHVALISCGWDPGLFSLIRYLLTAVLPEGKSYTLWGKGISQGHSDAIRRIDGVKDGRQYTIPIESALAEIMQGKNLHMENHKLHRRECFVVAEEWANLQEIEKEIKAIPDYFDGYDTVVNFITQDELNQQHKAFPHGGRVIRHGKTGTKKENYASGSFQLKLDSNPEFTAKVMTAYARAVYRLSQERQFGCKTVYDIPVSYLGLGMFIEM